MGQQALFLHEKAHNDLYLIKDGISCLEVHLVSLQTPRHELSPKAFMINVLGEGPVLRPNNQIITIKDRVLKVFVYGCLP